MAEVEEHRFDWVTDVALGVNGGEEWEVWQYVMPVISLVG